MTDDDTATVGIARTTSDVMELEISVEAHPLEGSAKLQILGERDLPNRGVSTTAYLPAEDARELGKELIAAADELEDHDGAREAAADD